MRVGGAAETNDNGAIVTRDWHFRDGCVQKETVFYDEVRRKEHEWGSEAGQERENKILELDE